MKLLFDHLVHFVENPDVAMTAFANLGFHTSKGGRHENWGTENTLCYFRNLQYIEWIGIDRIEVARNAKHPFSDHLLLDNQRGEGLSQIAFRTNSIENLQEELSHLGIRTVGPFPGARKRPDGSLLEWSMLFIESELPVPFYIQWGEEDAVREKGMLEKNMPPFNPNEISFIGYAVENPTKVANLWAKLLNVDVRDTDMVILGIESKGVCKKVHFHGLDIYFCNLPDRIKMRGERPFAVGIQPNEQRWLTLNGASYYI
ncbi:VOC family protein [Fredinandcohnia humi]